MSRISRRATVTAALPLGISLTLDQADATVVVIVLASPPEAARRRHDHQADKSTTLYAHQVLVNRRERPLGVSFLRDAYKTATPLAREWRDVLGRFVRSLQDVPRCPSVCGCRKMSRDVRGRPAL